MPGRGGDCSLRGIQEAMRRAFLARDRARGLHATLVWLVEELGELAEAVNRGDTALAGEEIADVIAWTLSVANLLGVDACEAVKAKYGRELRAAGNKGEKLGGPGPG